MPTPQGVPVEETGYSGVLTSLGGIQSQNGHGRVLTTFAFTFNAANGFPKQIWPSNPKRIALIIQNLGNGLGTGGVIGIYLSDLNQAAFALVENGSLQIDKDFPWTGAIYGATGGIDGNVVNINEVSVL